MIINKHVNRKLQRVSNNRVTYLKRTANLEVFIKHITDYRELMSRGKTPHCIGFCFQREKNMRTIFRT